MMSRTAERVRVQASRGRARPRMARTGLALLASWLCLASLPSAQAGPVAARAQISNLSMAFADLGDRQPGTPQFSAGLVAVTSYGDYWINTTPYYDRVAAGIANSVGPSGWSNQYRPSTTTASDLLSPLADSDSFGAANWAFAIGPNGLEASGSAADTGRQDGSWSAFGSSLDLSTGHSTDRRPLTAITPRTQMVLSFDYLIEASSSADCQPDYPYCDGAGAKVWMSYEVETGMGDRVAKGFEQVDYAYAGSSFQRTGHVDWIIDNVSERYVNFQLYSQIVAWGQNVEGLANEVPEPGTSALIALGLLGMRRPPARGRRPAWR